MVLLRGRDDARLLSNPIPIESFMATPSGIASHACGHRVFLTRSSAQRRR